MYLDYYNLLGPPFRLSPDHRFFYVAEPHKKAMAHLKYALSRGEGFVVITGEVGAGKTTLVEQVLADLAESHCVAGKVVTTHIEHEDLVQLVAAAFGIGREDTDKATALIDIRNFLEEQHKEGRRPVLFVDEVQNLPESSLEELRMLSNFSLPGQALLQIVLVGQPQFKRILADDNLEQLRQRVITSCHLQPLHAKDTRRYILHRLHQSGWKGDSVFSDRAFKLIYRLTDGVPRRINLLCDRLLLHGYLEQRPRITAPAVTEVAAEMKQEGLLDASLPDQVPQDVAPASAPKDDAPVPERPEAAPLDHPEEPAAEKTAAPVLSKPAAPPAIPLARVESTSDSQASGFKPTGQAADPGPDEPAAPVEERPAGSPARPSAPAAQDPTGETGAAAVVPLRLRALRMAAAAAVLLAVLGLPKGLWLPPDVEQSGLDNLVATQDAPQPVAIAQSSAPAPVANKAVVEAAIEEAEPAPPEQPAALLSTVVRDSGPQEKAAKNGSILVSAANPAGLTPPEADRPQQAGRAPSSDLGAEDGFVLQLAAFQTRDSAGQEQARLEGLFPELLGALELEVQQASIVGRPYFRVMTGVVQTRPDADDVCARLKDAGQDCVLRVRAVAMTSQAAN